MRSGSGTTIACWLFSEYNTAGFICQIERLGHDGVMEGIALMILHHVDYGLVGKAVPAAEILDAEFPGCPGERARAAEPGQQADTEEAPGSMRHWAGQGLGRDR